MNNAIVRINQRDWAIIKEAAHAAFASDALGLFKSEEAQIKMLTAWENGFPLTSAFQIVHVIENVPALSPKAVWAKVQIHPEFAGFEEERLTTAKGEFFGYRITLKRRNGMQATRQFTLEDAERAGLAKKNNWQAYAENMCFWRALGFVEDIVFPDVTLGMVRADDLGATVDGNGDVVSDGDWRVVESNGTDGVDNSEAEERQDSPRSQAQPAITLNDLVGEFGAEAVMQANEGRIPGTQEEIERAAVALRS